MSQITHDGFATRETRVRIFTFDYPDAQSGEASINYFLEGKDVVQILQSQSVADGRVTRLAITVVYYEYAK
jgi:hypothetical protein